MKTVIAAICFLCSIPSALLAQAPLIAPGDSGPLQDTTFAQDPELGSSSLDSEDHSFEVRGNGGTLLLSGILNISIVKSEQSDKVIMGHSFYDLSYASADIKLVRLVLTGYAGRQLRIGVRTDSSGEGAPTNVSRSTEDGDVLSFEFAGSSGTGLSNTLSLSMVTEVLAFTRAGSAEIVVANAADETFSTTLQNIGIPLYVPLDSIPSPRILRQNENEVDIEVEVIPGYDYQVWSSVNGQDWSWQQHGFSNLSPMRLTGLWIANSDATLFQVRREPIE